MRMCLPRNIYIICNCVKSPPIKWEFRNCRRQLELHHEDFNISQYHMFWHEFTGCHSSQMFVRLCRLVTGKVAWLRHGALYFDRQMLFDWLSLVPCLYFWKDECLYGRWMLITTRLSPSQRSSDGHQLPLHVHVTLCGLSHTIVFWWNAIWKIIVF